MGRSSFAAPSTVRSTGNGRIYGKLLLTGYHDNFVKIVAEWNQADNSTVADADKALSAFIPALMH